MTPPSDRYHVWSTSGRCGARTKEMRADAIFPRRSLVVPALVRKAKKPDYLLHLTVNVQSEMKKLIRCGVNDGYELSGYPGQTAQQPQIVAAKPVIKRRNITMAFCSGLPSR